MRRILIGSRKGLFGRAAIQKRRNIARLDVIQLKNKETGALAMRSACASGAEANMSKIEISFAMNLKK